MTNKDKLLEYIKANPDTGTADICRATGIKRRTAQRIINQLLESGTIKVSRYEKITAKHKRAERLFSADINRKANYIKVSDKDKHSRRMANQREKRALLSMLNKSKKFGVFGIAAVQVVCQKGNQNELRKSQ